jgi:hypothetical protein
LSARIIQERFDPGLFIGVALAHLTAFQVLKPEAMVLSVAALPSSRVIAALIGNFT